MVKILGSLQTLWRTLAKKRLAGGMAFALLIFFKR